MRRRLRRWRAPLVHEVAMLLAAAAVVQAVFWYRHDWPAHLVAGGGGVWVVASMVPLQRWRWAGLLGYVAMAGLGWASEHLLFGPFDLVDVSFTLAGALLAVDFASTVAAGSRRFRRQAALGGAGLIAAALVYRYGLS